jgi:hypothetical protein
MVVRAGYGLFYDKLGIDRINTNQGGFNQSTMLNPTVDNGMTFLATIGNPFPIGLLLPLGAAGGLVTNVGRAISYFNTSPVTPYMQRWTLSVQQELPQRVVIDIAYVGNRGTNLGSNRQKDPLPRNYLSTSPTRDQARIDYLHAQVANPFYGMADFAGTSLGNLKTDRIQLLRPFPQFTGMNFTDPVGFSYFHSLQVSAQKRFTKGLTFQASYTWSKFMDASTFLNESDPMPYKVISDLDRPMRLAVSVIYEMPFGRGKPVFGNANRFVNGLIGGWQLQGWYEGQSGPPLGFGNAIFTGDLQNIPVPLDRRRAERWFNTDAGFERAASKQLSDNVIGLSPRFSNVRADGINAFETALSKSFRLTETFSAQFRAEALNTLNHPSFNTPNTTPSSSSFGQCSGTGEERTMIFGLRLSF